jgi:hypothetical protein
MAALPDNGLLCGTSLTAPFSSSCDWDDKSFRGASDATCQARDERGDIIKWYAVGFDIEHKKAVVGEFAVDHVS